MSANKTGYLNSDFRIFYLTNTEERDFQSHYHDFHKLLIFESGSLSYYIEGETYQLQPWDLVLVSAGQVHRPIIHDNSPYRRLIIYISPAFLDYHREYLSELQEPAHLLRIKKFQQSRLYPVFLELQRSSDEVKNYSDVSNSLYTAAQPSAIQKHLVFYQQTVLLQFLLLLSQYSQSKEILSPAASVSNQQILQALTYINEHLQEELSVDQIAASCYLNRSYLMHLFRRETGYSIMSYVTEKRLFAARTLIQSGTPVTEACLQSGFQSYSAFYRAFRQKFGKAPKDAHCSPSVPAEHYIFSTAARSIGKPAL